MSLVISIFIICLEEISWRLFLLWRFFRKIPVQLHHYLWNKEYSRAKAYYFLCLVYWRTNEKSATIMNPSNPRDKSIHEIKVWGCFFNLFFRLPSNLTMLKKTIAKKTIVKKTIVKKTNVKKTNVKKTTNIKKQFSFFQ